jgi:hypothetical protein
MVINFNTLMKAAHTLKYLAFASITGLWACNSQQYAQKSTEYDDLYFSSKDRKEVVYTASTSGNYAVGNTGVASEDNSQQNVNPEYIQQYSQQSKKSNNSTNNETIQSGTNASDSYSADNSYYDENYRSNNGINLARDYNRRYNNSGVNVNFFPSYGFSNFYGGPAFYDPFYDPFFYQPYVGFRPSIIVNIGTGWGWGRWNRWNAWNTWNSWYDPFWGWGDPFYNRFAYNSWGWGWNDPFWGWGNPYRYNRYYGGGNVIIVNPGNNNGGSSDPRTVRYSPRSSRGSSTVNDNFDNSPRTGRAERGGRVDQSIDPNTNTGGRNNPNISDGEGRPARAIRPRSNENPDGYRPQNTPSDYNGAGSRTPAAVDNNNISTPRAVRPRGNSDAGNSNRNYNYSDNNYNNNRSSAPTYSAPSSGRSPRSSDYNTAPRNNSWNNGGNSNSNSNSNWNNSRSSGSSNSGGSYSAPSSSPRGGDGGSRSPRSPR